MIPETGFLLLFLSTINKELPELPPREGDYVYCYLVIERDEDGRLTGLQEKCNNG